MSSSTEKPLLSSCIVTKFLKIRQTGLHTDSSRDLHTDRQTGHQSKTDGVAGHRMTAGQADLLLCDLLRQNVPSEMIFKEFRQTRSQS